MSLHFSHRDCPALSPPPLPVSTATDEMLTAMSAQAVASFDAGDYGMAISWFRRLLKLLDPKDTQNRSYCLTSLAQCYFEVRFYNLRDLSCS